MLQDLANDISLIDKADYFHLTAALRTGQRVNLPHLLDALPPLRRWYFLWPVIRYINDFHPGRDLGMAFVSLLSLFPLPAPLSPGSNTSRNIAQAETTFPEYAE